MARRVDGGVDGGAWLIRCTGVEGAWGKVELRGRYLAGFDPDVVDPTGDWHGRSSWSRNREDAIRFLGREEAEACCHATPADAPLCPDGTPNRPLSVYRLACLPRSRRTPCVRASWNSSTGTGYLILPHDDARHVDGAQSPPPGWSQLPWTPRATCVQPGPFKASWIDIRPRHRRPDLAQISAHCTAERSKPRPDVHSPGAGAHEEDEQNQERTQSNPHSGALEAKCSP